MVVEDFANFWEWIGPACLWFIVIACICVVIGTVYGFMVSAARNGPVEAFYAVALVIAQSVPDLVRTSPRRVYALAKLSVQEAIRRRIILVTFAIFAVALLFGGWFLDVRSDAPNQVYLSFVLFGTQMLVLLTVMLISCFSLPQDIRLRTIYTVVTKPVRAFEIVVGRILGFGFLGSGLILAMGVISFFFVDRGLKHYHEVDLTTLEFVDPVTGETPSGRRASIPAVLEGRTSFNSHHSHQVEIVRLDESEDPHAPAGSAQFAVVIRDSASHYHDVVVMGDRPPELSADGVFTLDSEDDFVRIPELLRAEGLRVQSRAPEGYLQARVPIRATRLEFLDRAGNPTTDGVSVGDEWEYRSYIDGGTSQARAIFSFEGIFEDRFEEGDSIPLELTLGVFRTHKGEIERRVSGTIYLRSTVDGVEYESDPIIFESEEFQIQELAIPRQIRARWTDEFGTLQSKEMDLFEDFAPAGELELWLRCNESGQFFGVARADAYFRAKETLFVINFVKCYIGLWLQMMIVVSLCVSLSTFVSGPVGGLGSVALGVVMMAKQFIRQISTQELLGGGPVEAMWRLIKQENVTTELESGTGTTIARSIDWFFMKTIDSLSTSLPHWASIDTSEYLARGYDIGPHQLGINVAMSLSFCLIMALIGYFRLKTREIAA